MAVSGCCGWQLSCSEASVNEQQWRSDRQRERKGGMARERERLTFWWCCKHRGIQWVLDEFLSIKGRLPQNGEWHCYMQDLRAHSSAKQSRWKSTLPLPIAWISKIKCLFNGLCEIINSFQDHRPTSDSLLLGLLCFLSVAMHWRSLPL